MTPRRDDVTLAMRPAAYARWSARWHNTHSDFMQPVFALTSIAGRLSSGQMKGVPNARDQRGDRGRRRDGRHRWRYHGQPAGLRGDAHRSNTSRRTWPPLACVSTVRRSQPLTTWAKHVRGLPVLRGSRRPAYTAGSEKARAPPRPLGRSTEPAWVADKASRRVVGRARRLWDYQVIIAGAVAS
jgi:hypothetical protein